MMSDSKIRMADVFDLPVFAPVNNDDELKGDRLQHYAEFASRKMAKLAAHAINNHDHITAENGRLQDEVERLRAGRNSDMDEIDRIQGEYDKKFRQAKNLKQECDQLKEQLANLQSWLSKGIFYRLDELAEHDADVIDQYGQHIAWTQQNNEQTLTPAEYANKLRQQNTEEN